jgi:hypothetical protein
VGCGPNYDWPKGENMQNILRILIALGIIILIVLFLTHPRHDSGNGEKGSKLFLPDWGLHALWDDGQAEVATYDAHRVIYGKSRSYEASLITVKEDFDPKYFVKADKPLQGQSHPVVLKLNIASSIPTENYTYHFLTSLFVSRNDPFHIFKLTMGSQEWCGNTFKEIQNWDGVAALRYFSYFDGEGDGSLSLPLGPGDLLEDQIPLTLRSLRFQAGLRHPIRICDSLISNRAIPPKFTEAEIVVEEGETVQSIDCWKVHILRPGNEQLYWFEKAYPNILVKSVSPDGKELALKERNRRKYWEHPS